MAKVDVVMPQLGESLTEGTIVKWHKKPGDKIRKDETLLEISTDKVDSEIPSPVTGIITKLLFEEQKTVAVRTVIAEIDTDESASVSVAEVAKPAPVKAETPKPVEQKPVDTPHFAAPVTQAPASGRFYSPLVLNIAREENISMTELEQLPGSGEGGRVSKKDILAYVDAKKKGTATLPASSPTPAVAPTSTVSRIESTLKHVDAGELVKKYPAPQYEILQMSNVLQKMAEHMVKSVQTSPHVQAVHECDMTKIDNFR